MKLLSDNLTTTEQHIVFLAQKNIRERMAEALLFLEASSGLNTGDQLLNVALSREEVADFVGTSTEATVPLLTKFRLTLRILGDKFFNSNKD